jgi:hypothetical protein
MMFRRAKAVIAAFRDKPVEGGAIRLSYVLALSDKERQGLEGFLEDHDDCVGKLAFEVSSDNGIGVATEVICQCGGKRDITDYGLW